MITRVLVCLSLTVMASSLNAQQQMYAWEDIGIHLTLGMREDQGRAAVFHKPLDARFAGERIIVLDGQAPWIRIFDRQGTLLRSIAGLGDGPGEARRPMSVRVASDGGVIFAHQTGVERFDQAGTLLWSARGGLRSVGAMEACGALMVLLESPGAPVESAGGAIVRVTDSYTVLDTVLTIERVRGRSRLYHPWFAQSDGERLLLYPEEDRHSRLLEIGCSGRWEREIHVPPVGRSDSVAFSERGFTVWAPRPPHPAGLARVQGSVLWAVRDVLPRGPSQGVDSVTIVTAYSEDGEGRQIVIRGWYQLLDSNPDGELLVTNTWTYLQHWAGPATWGWFPTVTIIDGLSLLEVIGREGTTVPG